MDSGGSTKGTYYLQPDEEGKAIAMHVCELVAPVSAHEILGRHTKTNSVKTQS